MFKLLFKYVIPLLFLLAAGIVGYNYFYGTPAEQENSKQIIAKVKGLGSDVFNLLADEKQKFNDGKYDEAIDKIGDSLSYLKSKVYALADEGQQYINQLDDLQREEEQLRQQLQFLEHNPNAGSDATASARSSQPQTNALSAEQIQQRIRDLAHRTQKLGMDMGHR